MNPNVHLLIGRSVGESSFPKKQGNNASNSPVGALFFIIRFLFRLKGGADVDGGTPLIVSKVYSQFKGASL